MATTPEQIKNVAERRHPQYDCLLPHWQFMEDTYVGGREWFAENIFQYVKEGNDEYACRVARAYRFNHTREVVDLVNKYLFRSEISRNEQDAPDSVKKFWKNATLQGLDIHEFMKIASLKSSIGGRPWVIVDNTGQGSLAGAMSLAEQEKEDFQIYAYVVSPVDVLDMSYDDRGNLNWIVIREYKRDDEDPFEASGCVDEVYRLWTRTEWFLIEQTGTTKDKEGRDQAVFDITDQGEHGLGVVPAVKVDNTMTDDPWSSPALVADIAYLDRATANYASNLDAIIQDQTFSQLAMPAQNLMPGDDAYNKVLEMGTKRIFIYDGEGGKGPEFISPDPRQASLIIAAIEKIINEIYHSVGLAGERTKQDNSQGIDNSSGVAKAHDFERVTALLASKADSLEMVENRIAHLVALWAGEEIQEGIELVKYPDTFDVRTLMDELDISLKLSVVDIPESFRSEQAKILLEKLFPSLGETVKEEMKADIAEWAKRLKETSDAELKALKQSGQEVLGEARRNRTQSGSQQSKSKSRATGKT